MRSNIWVAFLGVSSMITLSGCSSIAEIDKRSSDAGGYSGKSEIYDVYNDKEYYMPKIKKKDIRKVDGIFDESAEFMEEGKSAEVYHNSINENHMIFFDFDSYEIKKEYKNRLDGIAEFSKKDPEKKIIIEGHTDAIGTAAYNMYLGSKRADAVKKYLRALGVKNEIKVISYGETEPLDPNNNEKNRRSVVVFLKNKIK